MNPSGNRRQFLQQTTQSTLVLSAAALRGVQAFADDKPAKLRREGDGLAAAFGQPDKVMEDVRAHGIRMPWATSADETVVDRLKASGFNAITFTAALLQNAKVVNPAPGAPLLEGTQFVEETVANITQRVEDCARLDMLCMPHIMLQSGDEWPHLQGKTYRKAVSSEGVTGDRAPCPVDRRIWLEFHLPQMVALARIMEKAGCAGGIMLEAEMYAAHDIYPGYQSQKREFCYCDDCWGRLVAKLDGRRRPGRDLAPTERYPWLSAQGMLWDYELHMREELASLMKEVASEVRKVMPKAFFGLYPASITWHNDALIEGLGTRELPFVVFSRAEYYPGFTAYPGENQSHMYASTDHLRHLEALGLPYLYLGGLMAGHHWPHRFGLEIARLQREADGVWVFGDRNVGTSWEGRLVMRPEAGRHGKSTLDAAAFLSKAKEANDIVGAWPRRHASKSTEMVRTTLWKDIRLDGPAGAPQIWNAANPPTPEGGWRAWAPCAGGTQLMMPPVHPAKKAILFDLQAASSSPKATSLDYSFRQPAEQTYLWSVEVRYEGGPLGARVSLRHSGSRNLNSTVYAEDGWAKLWQLLPARPADEDRWVRIVVHPNAGRVWVRRMLLAPAKVTILQSDRLALKPGLTWGRVDWELESGGDCMAVCDVYEGDGVRPLYTGQMEGFDLGDISRIYGITEVELEGRFVVPAGSSATLVRFDVGGVGERLSSRRPSAQRKGSPSDPD